MSGSHFKHLFLYRPPLSSVPLLLAIWNYSLWRVVEGPRLCSDQGSAKGMHGALTTRAGDFLHSPPPPRLSVGLDSLLLLFLEQSFFFLRPHLQWLFTAAQGISLFALSPILHKWRLLSNVDIQEEERKVLEMEFPVSHTWVYFPCPELQHQCSLITSGIAWWERVCAGSSNDSYPGGFCSVPPAT